MNILVIDGQGGGLGRQLVSALKNALPEAEIMAVGTNSMATGAMLKAGADHAATGENAVIVACRKADVIVGKPHKGIVDEALLRTGFGLEEMAMVGDRLYTDVATGVRHGMQGILVLSGEATMDDVATSDVQPDLIFGKLADMIPYL